MANEHVFEEECIDSFSWFRKIQPKNKWHHFYGLTPGMFKRGESELSQVRMAHMSCLFVLIWMGLDVISSASTSSQGQRYFAFSMEMDSNLIFPMVLDFLSLLEYFHLTEMKGTFKSYRATW